MAARTNRVRARTCAYLPRSIEGHAVLVALACEEIAMAPLAELGAAGIDEAVNDQVILDGYEGIALRRGSFPVAAIRALLDREATLFRVELNDEQLRFVDRPGLEELQKAGRVISETQLSIPGQLGRFTGKRCGTGVGLRIWFVTRITFAMFWERLTGLWKNGC